MLKMPAPVSGKLCELEKLVEENPITIPLNLCAEFLGMAADSLRRSIELGKCPFAIGWTSPGGSYRGSKIPTVTFWLWYTAGKVEEVTL